MRNCIALKKVVQLKIISAPKRGGDIPCRVLSRACCARSVACGERTVARTSHRLIISRRSARHEHIGGRLLVTTAIAVGTLYVGAWRAEADFVPSWVRASGPDLGERCS